MKLSRSARVYLLTLKELSEQQTEVRQRDLAERLGYSRASICRAVSSLTQQGLIRNEKGILMLSDQGQSMAETIQTMEKALVAGLKQLGMDDHQAQSCLKNPEGLYQEELIALLKQHFAEA